MNGKAGQPEIQAEWKRGDRRLAEKNQSSHNTDSLPNNPNHDEKISFSQFDWADALPSDCDIDLLTFDEFDDEFSDFSRDDEFASASGFFEILPDKSNEERDSIKSSYQTEIIFDFPSSDESKTDSDHQADDSDTNDQNDSEFPQDESNEIDVFGDENDLGDEEEFELTLAFELDLEEFDSVWEQEEISNRIWTGDLERIKLEITDEQIYRAKDRATEIVQNLDCTNSDEIENATEFFFDFFISFSHNKTFSCLRDIASSHSPSFQLIQSVIELRSTWLENYAGMRAMYLSWMNAYKFCSYLKDNPIDEYCIGDWYDKILEYYFDYYNWSPTPEFDRDDEYQFGFDSYGREHRNIDDFLEDRIPYLSQRFYDFALSWMHNCDGSDTESDDFLYRLREQFGYQIEWHY